jgi:hypothetical protein
MDDLELAQGTAYSYVNRLVDAGVVDVFQSEREAKGTPPDRGLSLEYALRENKK